MAKVIDIPTMVCGQLRYPQGKEIVEVEYMNGITARLPRLSVEDIETIVANRELLHDVSLAEVSRYLSAAGALWVDPDNRLRQEAVDLACQISGYSPTMLHRDYWIIGDYMMFRNNYYDLLDAELGDHRMLDTWVRRQVAQVRAFPRGRVLHVMVGNVPMAGPYSILRSLLTRNHTVVKLPARDLVTCTYFARALIEANGADHPLSRALSVAYWEKDSDLWETMISSSDMVCAWGQGASLEAIKRKIPQGIPYLEFGPKRSFLLVYADECDLDKAALRIAHDTSVYDQEACFSPQRLFVLGDHVELVHRLEKWFEHQQNFLPKGTTSLDVNSHLLRTKLEAKFRGWQVIESNSGWTLIISKQPYTRTEHPLSRTLFIHPIDSVAEILPFVDDDTQTVGVYPFTRHAEEIGNLVCARGAVRLCEVGLVSHFRQGFTHDGAYPLQQFVRLAYLDVSLEYPYKYGPSRPEVMEDMLFGVSIGGSH